ncbi:MAG: hypothetical protein KBT21_08565 [Treponema sp.]|nr:hypothetical protein [Candidatus Treponema merdequi]
MNWCDEFKKHNPNFKVDEKSFRAGWFVANRMNSIQICKAGLVDKLWEHKMNNEFTEDEKQTICSNTEPF